eukprot:TRINITY_DN13811_c0_g1_i1.p1 TRINITY_DN13811_c0_g1~~TRINITY_DN13811_c0_g1_i1.p1  ORF type:complete len:347 (+),score=86.31 TRINITY_DN13811_c0_g1_i1:55-1095(+)
MQAAGAQVAPAPAAFRCRRPLAAFSVLVAASAAAVAIVRLSDSGAAVKDAIGRPTVQHPNLSRLRREDGAEVLLIGTLPLDLDGQSKSLVSGALEALQPDVVMVEGSPMAGVSALVLSGQWQMHGMPPPNFTERANIGDAAPVAIQVVQQKRGFLGLGGAPEVPRLPSESIVPVKVGTWAHHLMSAVGGDVAQAVSSAASYGVPVLWLGPQEGSFQGHMQVAMLAEQAVKELLEEEGQMGGQMPTADVDAALLSAESRIRFDSAKWLLDARGMTARMTSTMGDRVPPEVREELAQRLRHRAFEAAMRINSAMREYSKGAVVISVDQLVGVEDMLLRNGFRYVSDFV